MLWKRHMAGQFRRLFTGAAAKGRRSQTNEAKNVKCLFLGAWWEIMCKQWGERKNKAFRRPEEKLWTQTVGLQLRFDTKRTYRKRKAANKLHNLCLFHLFKCLSTPSSVPALRAGNVTVGIFQSYYSDLLLSPAFWIINWQSLHHKHRDPARSNYGGPVFASNVRMYANEHGCAITFLKSFLTSRGRKQRLAAAAGESNLLRSRHCRPWRESQCAVSSSLVPLYHPDHWFSTTVSCSKMMSGAVKTLKK